MRAAALALVFFACGQSTDPGLILPQGFPAPIVPRDNPQTPEKAELGRHLFYDKRLSLNGTQSCASCHEQARAFTDGKSQGLGSTGALHSRGAMSLANVAYASVLTWGNPLQTSLEAQALVPLFGDNPVELGLAGKENLLFARLAEDGLYRDLFAAAFPEDPSPINLSNLTKALASFERTLISGNSAYDRLVYQKDSNALSPAAKRGLDLFFGEKLECFHCHGGITFSDATKYQGMPERMPVFHNTGLYNVDGMGSYPRGNQGVFDISQNPLDRGRFKAPTLRNIAVTAPYMHDGSIATLREVLTQHYEKGGRTLETGDNAGDGSKNPNKSILVRPFSLTEEERNDVLEFLQSLTDETFLREPRFSDPFKP